MATAHGHIGLPLSAQPEELPGGSWAGAFVAGTLATIAGIAAIVVPSVATVAIALFIGWILIGGGALLLIDAISIRSVERGVVAVLAIAAGIYLLVAPLHGTVTLTFILALYFIVAGVLRLSIGWLGRGMPRAGLLMLNGAISLVVGLLIAFNLPSASDWAIGLLVGIDFLFIGLTTMVIALADRRLEKRAAGGPD